MKAGKVMYGSSAKGVNNQIAAANIASFDHPMYVGMCAGPVPIS